MSKSKEISLERLSKQLEEIKKLLELSKPTEIQYPYIDSVDSGPPCMFEAYYNNLPESEKNKTHILGLSCPCRKCSTWC